MKINFADFANNFDQDDFITPILNRHFDWELSDKPDILFCSTMHHSVVGDTYDCPKIVWTGESHSVIERGIFSMGFEPENERNFYLPLWQVYLMNHPEYWEYIKNRKYIHSDLFCAAAINNETQSERNRIFDLISDYKEVDSYGTYRNNKKGTDRYSPKWHDIKIDFFRENHYKFLLCPENRIWEGYVTEKLLDAFVCNSIPIYWGTEIAKEWFNPKAFIDTSKPDFIEQVKHFDEHPEEIMSESVFVDELNVINHINRFEVWLVEKIKSLL